MATKQRGDKPYLQFLGDSLHFILIVMVVFCMDLAGSWCPDMWSNIILDVSLKVYVHEVNI